MNINLNLFYWHENLVRDYKNQFRILKNSKYMLLEGNFEYLGV